jgi:hypothetical protein
MTDRVCVIWAGLLEKPFEVVHRRPRLMLIVACGGWGAPHTGATRLAILAIDRGHGPLKALFVPLFALLMPSWVLWAAMLDDVSL